MDFDQIKGFYFAAKLKSFTEAAEKLYLTQPAISLQVKALERELGEKLFERTGRTMRLTHIGRLFYLHAEQLLDKLDELQQVVKQVRELECGQLDIGASDTTSLYVLPGLLRSFKETHPKIQLSIESLFSGAVMRKVLERDLDLGIVTLRQVDARLQALPLFSQRLVGVVPKGHPLAACKSVKLARFSKEPLILLGKESQTRGLIEDILQRRHCSARVALELSNFELIKRYVAAGFGSSVVPEDVVSNGIDGIEVVRFSARLNVEVGVVHRRDRVLSRSASAFLEMARSYFSASHPSLPGSDPAGGPGHN